MLIISFCLGATVLFVLRDTYCKAPKIKEISSLPLLKHSGWNGSDYQSNSEYYKKLTAQHDFTQLDNLRLDRLSSPRFHPSNGKSVMYLRKQYHMPDLKRSSTTLHWVDIETNKTVQLTRPIWDVHDRQVQYFSNDNQQLISSIVLVLLGER